MCVINPYPPDDYGGRDHTHSLRLFSTTRGPTVPGYAVMAVGVAAAPPPSPAVIAAEALALEVARIVAPRGKEPGSKAELRPGRGVPPSFSAVDSLRPPLDARDWRKEWWEPGSGRVPADVERGSGDDSVFIAVADCLWRQSGRDAPRLTPKEVEQKYAGRSRVTIRAVLEKEDARASYLPMRLIEWRRHLSFRGVILARMWIDELFIAGKNSPAEEEAVDKNGHAHARAVIVAGHRINEKRREIEYLVRSGFGEAWAEKGYLWVPHSLAAHRFLEGFGVGIG